ncbi:MAG TPA: alpha/beta hydrolase [Candidatus Latescibacteria bacterium]|mgnify:FL=1|nr:alpha/beta hydrolase [Candidatus Latescibacterota bacterium]HPK74679.1 alpha/beta hydrolase [Candidatus Latescibacterota bacterium]
MDGRYLFMLTGKAALYALAAFVGFVAAGLLVAVGLVWINSSGRPKPFLDSRGNPLAGSISEKIFVNINGTKQGMFIKGKRRNAPVLLYLHGGMPDYFLTDKYPTGLDELFTVVWWEQRGSGISYDSGLDRSAMTVDTMMNDVITVADYLRQRFRQDRIYLMGHSGGTFLGIKVAATHPELFRAYIGVSQISRQKVSEKLAYDYMVRRFAAEGNADMVGKLRESPVTLTGQIPDSYLKIRDEAMHELGIGTMRNMRNVFTDLFIPSLLFDEYSLGEKYRLWAGKSHAGVSVIWNDIISRDLSEEITSLDIPVYFLHGRYDYTCSFSLAEEFFRKIEAPVKGFYIFEKSAHCPLFEEPLKTVGIIRDDILRGRDDHADVK